MSNLNHLSMAEITEMQVHEERVMNLVEVVVTGQSLRLQKQMHTA